MNNEIILYQPDSSISLEVRVEDETVWLTQQQIADLFGTKRPAITKPLSNTRSHTSPSSQVPKNLCYAFEHTLDPKSKIAELCKS